jgi:magnesium-transporting ATPase (P-type)
MRIQSRRWLGLGVLLAMLSLLVPGSALYAQREGEAAAIAALGAALIFGLVIGLAFYVYYSLALQTIAKKTNTENAWLAWIPIVNFILMLNIAKKPLWWFILCLIPLVNIVVMIIVWMAIAEARNKPSWWGIMLIVPIVNIVVPGYLAWSD